MLVIRQSFFKRWILLCLIGIFIFFSGSPSPSQAAQPGELNAPPNHDHPGLVPAAPVQANGQPPSVYLPVVFQQDQEEPPPADQKQVALALYQNQYLVSNGINPGWTGNIGSCTPGSTSQAFRDAVLKRVNYFRAAAGLPADITFSDADNAKAQAAALMMSANGILNHAPPATWKCYTSAGADGAGHSNLYLGEYGYDAVTGYIMDPGSNNFFTGHRRWILYPPAKVMGSGDILGSSGVSSNALYVLDSQNFGAHPQPRDGFVAWPPSGYIPYLLAFSRWSFSIPGANFESVQITMTQDGANLPVRLETTFNDRGYGDNSIVWVPNYMTDYMTWSRPDHDTVIKVVLSGVIVNKTPQTYQYTVTIFDPDE